MAHLFIRYYPFYIGQKKNDKRCILLVHWSFFLLLLKSNFSKLFLLSFGF